MPIEHIVAQGECIGCIAYQYGLMPAVIWDDPANSDLKERRKDPNVLFPGDVVQIPDKRVKSHDGQTEKRHRFARKSVPAQLHLELRLQEGKLANQEFELVVGSSTTRGRTDSDGRLSARIPPDASEGWIVIMGRKVPFRLGTLDPLETVTGQQQRLNQLGFHCGAVDGIHGPLTTAGVRAFQKAHGLTVDGIVGPATRSKLHSEYGG